MKKILANLGLEEKEISIFLECVKNKKNTPTSIGKNCNIKRSTVYFYLEKLKEKNLIKQKIEGVKNFIIAKSAENCAQELINTKEFELGQTINNAQELQKKMQSLYDQPNKSIAISQGKQALKKTLTEILKTKENIFWIGDLKSIFPFISEKEFFKTFTLDRFKNDTQTYAITSKSILNFPQFSETIGKFRNFEFITEDIPGILAATKSKIYFFKEEENLPVVINIHDTTLTNLIQKLFQIIWKNKKN